MKAGNRPKMCFRNGASGFTENEISILVKGNEGQQDDDYNAMAWTLYPLGRQQVVFLEA